MGLFDKMRGAMAEAAKHSAYNGDLGGVHLLNGEVRWVNGGRLERKSVEGAVASFDAGNASTRIGAGRVIAGGVLFGPVGAVAGGLLRKQAGRVYVTIEWPDGGVVIAEGPVKDEGKAREFAARVSRAGRDYPLG